MKTCVLCHVEKPLSEFHFQKSSTTKTDSRCKKCKSIAAHENRVANYFKSYTQTKRAECKKKGYIFNLTAEHLESIWTGICPIFNVPLSYDHSINGFINQAHLDRMNPDLGYVIGNVTWISGRANRIKFNATKEELKSILEYMEK